MKVTGKEVIEQVGTSNKQMYAIKTAIKALNQASSSLLIAEQHVFSIVGATENLELDKDDLKIINRVNTNLSDVSDTLYDSIKMLEEVANTQE